MSNLSEDKISILAKIEALLFAASDGLTVEELAQYTDSSLEKIGLALEQLGSQLETDERRGLFLRKIRDRYLFSTKRELSTCVIKLFQERPLPKLTRAAYEVLAVVAYNQPCTRLQIEAVRGVNSDSVISRLLEVNLIEQSGILDLPGRPSLYSVSENFLRSFGLSSVNDLPTMELLQYESLRRFESSANEAGFDSLFEEE